jgi:CRP-like cAMP-binding protein
MTEGIVKVIIKKEGTEEVVNSFHLKKGSYFGEVALLT